MSSILLTLEQLFADCKKLAETKWQLYKLKFTLVASTVTAELVYYLSIILIIIFFLVFVSIGLALLIGMLTGKSYFGFFIVSLLYAIGGTICFLLRKKIIKTPICNFLLHKMVKGN